MQTFGEYKSARAYVADVCRQVWRRRERLPLPEWCEKHRRISARASSRPGAWRNDAAPYLEEIMRSMSDPLVTRVSVRKPSQSGWTEAIFNALMRDAECDPQPWMLVFPNQAMAESAFMDRLVPSIRASPTVSCKLPEKGVRSEKLTFEGMTAFAVGSNSDTNLKSRPIAKLAMDEIDEFEPGADELAERRTDTFPGRRIFAGSTPTSEGVGIDARYHDGDQRRLECPCPRCGEYQELVLGGLRWEKGTRASTQEIRASVHYKCRHCGGEILEYERADMVARGKWVREGQTLTREGELEGTPLRDYAGAPGQHHSYRYNALIVLIGVSWADLAIEWVHFKGDPTPHWINHRLGEPYRQKGQRVEIEHLRRHCLAPEEGGYTFGTVPRGVLALTGSIDVQKGRAFVQVRGHGERGEKSWLIYYNEVALDNENDTEAQHVIDRLVGMTFPLAGGDKHPLYGVYGERMPVAKVAIDSGKWTEQVYRWCLRHPDKLVPVKGVSSEAMSTAWRQSPIEAKREGTDQRDGLVLLLVNTIHWKNEIVRRLQAAPPGGGGERDDEAPATWFFPAYEIDYSTGEETRGHDEYLLQLSAEELVIEPIKRGRYKGRLLKTWRRRPGRVDNHYLDCTVYDCALADWAGLKQLTLAAVLAAASGDESGGAEAVEAPRTRERGHVSPRRFNSRREGRRR